MKIIIEKEYNKSIKELAKLNYIVDSNSARKDFPMQQLVYNIKKLRELEIFEYNIEDR